MHGWRRRAVGVVIVACSVLLGCTTSESPSDVDRTAASTNAPGDDGSTQQESASPEESAERDRAGDETDGAAGAAGAGTATGPAAETSIDSDAADVPTDQPVAPCAQPWRGPRVDLEPTGNRITDQRVDLDAPLTQIGLPAPAVWIVATPVGWHVELADATAVIVDRAGVIEATDSVGGPPATDADGTVRSSLEDGERFADRLYDSRVIHAGTDTGGTGSLTVDVALTGPTDRYGHGVLGDRIEATGFELVDRCTGSTTTVELSDPDVIEGITALAGDADGDGVHEILVTISNASVGARLALYSLTGDLLAESTPIGRGNRWRNQLAIAPVGPTGEIEVIDVRTPHIGGTVEFFRLVDERLELVAASTSDYTTHSIGSRNLDMGIVADVNDDGQLDVIVPTSRRNELVAMTRVEDGVEVLERRSLDGSIVTNLAVDPDTGALALGTGRGDLIVIGAG
ncbi:MAG: hypothetical protein AAF567_02980 [Actinomycetota bacterium]